MALPQSALSELFDAIRAGDGADVLRDAMALVLQELIELEATTAIGAGRYERTDERAASPLWSAMLAGRVATMAAADAETERPSARRTAHGRPTWAAVVADGIRRSP